MQKDYYIYIAFTTFLLQNLEKTKILDNIKCFKIAYIYIKKITIRKVMI